MVSALNELHIQFTGLQKAVDHGKMISISLKADDKPSRFKMISLSCLTFGIYYGVYKYRHDRERVFRKITSRISERMNNYKLILKKVVLLDEPTKLKLEEENKSLHEIKNIIDSNESDFLDQVFFKEADHKLKELAFNIYKTVLVKSKFLDNKKQSIFSKLKEQLKTKPNRTLEEQIFYNSMQTPDQIKFTLNLETKKISWKLSNLTNEQNHKQTHEIYIEGIINLPSIKSEIVSQIDSAISSNDQQLDQSMCTKEELIKFTEIEKNHLKNSLDATSSLISSIWQGSHNPKKQEIELAEGLKLLSIKQSFLQKIDTEKERLLDSISPL